MSKESAIEEQEKKPPLEDWQVKELLIDIEKIGGRGKTNQFLEICNRNVRIYGSSGSEKRRRFQRALENLKRRKPQSYLDLVLKHDVQPSAATLREAEVQEQPFSGKLLCCLDLLLFCCWTPRSPIVSLEHFLFLRRFSVC
jgi:hypothetical protein